MNSEDPRTRLKICGITTLEDARFASGALCDYLGYIFYSQSPRYIEPAKAAAITEWVEGPDNVGVFVDENIDEVNDIAHRAGMDLVQLHGTETPEYCRLIDKPIIKTFRVDGEMKENEIHHAIEPYLEVADYLLFDTKDADNWGGTGKTFDWNILKDLGKDIPFFLAGGLNASNVRRAINTVAPYAVDISSGIELEPGIKDFDKINNLVEEMREIWDLQEE